LDPARYTYDGYWLEGVEGVNFNIYDNGSKILSAQIVPFWISSGSTDRLEGEFGWGIPLGSGQITGSSGITGYSTENQTQLSKAVYFFDLPTVPSPVYNIPNSSKWPTGWTPDGFGQDMNQMEFNAYFIPSSASSVPVPSTLVLLGPGIVALLGWRRVKA
jgi:hypothetical protein